MALLCVLQPGGDDRSSRAASSCGVGCVGGVNGVCVIFNHEALLDGAGLAAILTPNIQTAIQHYKATVTKPLRARVIRVLRALLHCCPHSA